MTAGNTCGQLTCVDADYSDTTLLIKEPDEDVLFPCEHDLE